MRIALAHDHLNQLGGAEVVLKELSCLFSSAPIYTLIHSKELDFLRDKSIITSFLQHLPGGVNMFKLYLSLMPVAWEIQNFDQYDLVISSCSSFVKGLRIPPTATHICYCHTPTRYLWGETEEYLQSLKIAIPLKKYLRRLLNELRIVDRLAAERVDIFVANSNYIAHKIQKYYGRASLVIYPPVNINKFFVSENPGNYYLLVSRLRPYKRVDLAIEAFNHLKLPLVIAGDGEEFNRLRHLARHNIKFLGEVSNEKRNKLLSRCKAFIHPQEEDFGISAVEAMASGRPVIAFGAGGALETVIPQLNGILFEEQTWESLAYAVINTDAEEFNPEAIRHSSRRFDRDRFKDGFEKVLSLIKK